MDPKPNCNHQFERGPTNTGSTNAIDSHGTTQSATTRRRLVRSIPAQFAANDGRGIYTIRMMNVERITIDSEQCGGRPCIRGMRIRVKDILDMLASGASRAEMLEDYPYLEDLDITAALEFASRATDHPVISAAE
jgi:uncharacterized protein (DUF433 family)